MDSQGNPDWQDVREGQAWVNADGVPQWNLPPAGSSGAPDTGLSPDTVTVTAPAAAQTPSSSGGIPWWMWVLVLGGGYWLLKEAR